MSTSVPEKHVGDILRKSFPYVYKPVDSRHAGATKIDFICCTDEGLFAGVEVKATSNQRFFNPRVRGARGISAGQRNALDSIVAGCGEGHAYVVVAPSDEEYLVYDWAEVKDQDRWSFTDCSWVLHPRESHFYPWTAA